ncbi:hypothetical protein HanRHA438_Chr00c04g0845131 [Helianthus annuus]|nr:hypothetical protein HanRHA438_Chr00c04g0845131 [Helianthus annuus]
MVFDLYQYTRLLNTLHIDNFNSSVTPIKILYYFSNYLIFQILWINNVPPTHLTQFLFKLTFRLLKS